MGLFEAIGLSQQQSQLYNLMAMQGRPLGSFGLSGGLLGILGQPASSANIPEIPATPKPFPSLYEPVLSFIQTLRNEIDEWLKI